MRRALLCSVLISGSVTAALGQASIEGRVDLPKTKSAPVMAKRYEIVTTGGVLATNPVYKYNLGLMGNPSSSELAMVSLVK